jgi:hypothetical protein
VSANHILQNFLSVENFPEWKWTCTQGDLSRKTCPFLLYTLVSPTERCDFMSWCQTDNMKFDIFIVLRGP